MSSCCNVCLEKDDIKTVLFFDLDDHLMWMICYRIHHYKREKMTENKKANFNEEGSPKHLERKNQDLEDAKSNAEQKTNL